MPVFEFNTFDGQMQLNNPEWIVDDPVVNQWERGKQVRFAEGLTYENASEINLASDNPLSLEDVGARFGIKELPPEIQSNKTQQFVEWLGRQGWFSMLLFLVGIVCLSAELSTPGVTLPGILAAICFGLFFWIHLFQGTVEWLEVLLILGGALCLAMELFVLPGFGVFGVTGLVLLAVGLLLAGQTFVIPTNRYQWERTSQSIGQLGLLVVSLFAAAVIFRKQLANLPMIRWFALQPPKMDRELLEKEQLEEGLRSLIGWYGTTVSRCNPSGKAMIGDRIYSVVSSTTWLDEDTEVEVESVHENALVVKPRVS
jgi:membrane-bound ClpP family serine protease